MVDAQVIDLNMNKNSVHQSSRGHGGIVYSSGKKNVIRIVTQESRLGEDIWNQMRVKI